MIPNLSVSRETLDRLESFAELLKKWTQRINLISPDSVPHIWDRHILDSAQIFPLIPPTSQSHADLGSGGGLPGIVLSILFKESAPNVKTTLVESDARKSTFLRTAIRELGLNATVKTARIMDVPALGADLITVRALAPLNDLIPMINLHLASGGTAILSKGRNHKQEIDSASKSWHISITEHPSLTDPDARLLEVKDIMRVTP